MPRKINLRAVRDVLPRDGSVMSQEALAEALGVDPKSVKSTLPKALWEACGIKIARSPRGRILGVQRWDRVEEGWSEPIHPDLRD